MAAYKDCRLFSFYGASCTISSLVTIFTTLLNHVITSVRYVAPTLEGLISYRSYRPLISYLGTTDRYMT